MNYARKKGKKSAMADFSRNNFVNWKIVCTFALGINHDDKRLTIEKTVFIDAAGWWLHVGYGAAAC
jgi:hypothetical protein